MKAVLRKMRELLAEPKQWTQGCSFRDAEGNPGDRNNAVSYCIAGAHDVACEIIRRNSIIQCGAALSTLFGIDPSVNTLP